MKSAPVIVALVSCLAAACRTAAPPALPANLLACGNVQDPAERVRCYDTQIAAMNRSRTVPAAPAEASSTATGDNASATSAASPPAPSAEAAPPAAGAAQPPQSAQAAAKAPNARSLEERFGSEQLPPTERPTPPPRAEVLHASIASLNEVRPNLYVIALSNGQVWLQSGAELLRLFHVGDHVSIARGMFDSYHLSDDALGAKNDVLVNRIQ